MPRPLVALAIVFAIVIGAAAVLLYRADRQSVLEMAERSAPAAAEAPAPAAAAPEPRPAQPPPETATEETTTPLKEPVDAAEGTKPAAPEAAGNETSELELAPVPEPSTPAGETGQATGAATAATSVAESPKVAATETSGPAATLQSPPPDEQVAAVQPETGADASPSESAASTTPVGQQAVEVAPGGPEGAPNRRQIADGGAAAETQPHPRVATLETTAASSGPAEEEPAAAAQAVAPTPESPAEAGGVQAPRTAVQSSEAATPEEQATLAAPSAQPPPTPDAAPPVRPAASTNPPADDGPTAAEPTPAEHQPAAAESPAEILVAPDAPAIDKQSSIAASESGVPTAPANEPSEPSVAASETPTKPIVPKAVPTEEQAAAAAAGETTTEPEPGPGAVTLGEEVAAAHPEAPVSATPPTTRPAPDSKQELAAIEPAAPPAATAVPTPSEAVPPSPATHSGAPQAEATAPTIESPAAPPIRGEAPTIALNIESATSELPQVAIEIPASVPAEALLQWVEITGFEVLSSPPDALAAEASVDAEDLSGLAVAGDSQSHEITGSAEAAPGIPDARDVTIKAAEAEDKMLYVAGDAPPGALVRVFADEKLVGEARTDINGVWLLEAEKALPAGEVVFRVEATPETDAATTPIVEASAPFMRFADGVVLEPVGAVEAGEDAFALSEAGAPMLSYVIIRRGDNLWRIARRNYERGIKYQAIYAANQDQIRNPHWIFPGQVFVIPTRDRSWEAVSQ